MNMFIVNYSQVLNTLKFVANFENHFKQKGAKKNTYIYRARDQTFYKKFPISKLHHVYTYKCDQK